MDTDRDGIGNNADADDDGDRQTDANEVACGSNPLDRGSLALDTDSDHSPNCVDADDDGDGFADEVDQCPLVTGSNNAGQSGYQCDAATSTWRFNWKTTGLAAGCYYFTFTNNEVHQTDEPFQVRLTQ